MGWISWPGYGKGHLSLRLVGEGSKERWLSEQLVPTNTKVPRNRFEEWVLGLLLGLGGTERCWGGLFAGLRLGRLLDGSLRQVSTERTK